MKDKRMALILHPSVVNRHKCKYTSSYKDESDCDNMTDDHDYCRIHRCEYANCPNPVAISYSYRLCQYHQHPCNRWTGMGLLCRRTRVSGSFHCDVHTCSIPSCNESVHIFYDGSTTPHCLKHQKLWCRQNHHDAKGQPFPYLYPETNGDENLCPNCYEMFCLGVDTKKYDCWTR
jgi:hypothetical protein